MRKRKVEQLRRSKEKKVSLHNQELSQIVPTPEAGFQIKFVTFSLAPKTCGLAAGHGPVKACKVISFPPFFESCDAEHEPDNFFDLRPAGTVQAVPVSRVIMPAIIRRQFVTVRRRIRMPEITGHPLFHQPEVPRVNDATKFEPLQIPCAAMTAGVSSWRGFCPGTMPFTNANWIAKAEWKAFDWQTKTMSNFEPISGGELRLRDIEARVMMQGCELKGASENAGWSDW